VRFLFSSENDNSAASLSILGSLRNELIALGHVVEIDDCKFSKGYDILIYLGSSLNVREVKKNNPDIVIGLADPKPYSYQLVTEVDFCIVSSVEQREVFVKYNRNQFIFYMTPIFDSCYKHHQSKDRYKISYHGNLIHLNTSGYTMIPALLELSNKYSISLELIYNLKGAGKWNLGRPRSSRLHILDRQWYPNCYIDYFKGVDIGVMPNFIPNKGLKCSNGPIYRRAFLESSDDHVLKFKSSSNAGRAFVFSKFGIPVVADATPSASEFIMDDHSGKLVISAEGWYNAIEDLILSHKKRNFLAKNSINRYEKYFSPHISAKRFIEFIGSLKDAKVINIDSDISAGLVSMYCLKNKYFRLKRLLKSQRTP
jgi:glycosyltransferase involved in cell wall biosynthesis